MPCDTEDYDGPEILCNTYVVSEKAFDCCECALVIIPSIKHVRISYIDDMCVLCAEIRTKLFDNQVEIGDLWYAISGCIKDITSKDLDKLSVLAIKKIERRTKHLFNDKDSM